MYDRATPPPPGFEDKELDFPPGREDCYMWSGLEQNPLHPPPPLHLKSKAHFQHNTSPNSPLHKPNSGMFLFVSF